MHDWTPAGTNRVQTKRPNVGDVVAYAHAAWLVEHVQDAIPTDEEAAALAAYRPGFREKLSPYSYCHAPMAAFNPHQKRQP